MASQNPHVLIVEDHQFMRDALGILLKNLGFRVTPAASAANALVLAQTQHFHMMLLDIHLPGERDGWGLLRAMRDQALLPPWVVTMSAYLRNREHEQSMESGCDVHLIKPFRVLDLEKALQRGRLSP